MAQLVHASYFQAGRPTSLHPDRPWYIGSCLQPLLWIWSASHLRPLQESSPSSQAQGRFPSRKLTQNPQATSIPSLLNTYCIDPEQKHIFQGLILFHLLHVTCFLAVKPLRSAPQTSERREARCPTPHAS